MEETEKRAIPVQLELKKDANNRTIVVGLAAVYNSQSKQMTDKRGRRFIEEVEPGFFSNVMDQDVVATIEHDHTKIVGRTTAGTLKITDTRSGLQTENDVAQTSHGKDLLVNIERGEIKGMSFEFRCKDGGDKWERRSDGTLKRTLKAGGCEMLADITYTGNPIYPSTALEMRSLDAFEAAEKKDHDAPEALVIEENERNRRIKLAEL